MVTNRSYLPLRRPQNRRFPRWAAVLVVLAVLVAASQESLAQDVSPVWQADATPIAFDWVQLTSREWLKGEFLGMYEDELEFDSDKMDFRTFKWKDVYEVRTARVMEVGLTTGAVAIGKLVIVGAKARVIGDGAVELDRAQIATIAQFSAKRFRSWGGKVSLGATVLRGNVNQLDANVNAGLKRRTAGDRIVLDYIANFTRTDRQTIAENQRLNGNWDYFITDRFFVNPVVLEWFSDPFLNVASRSSAGVGAGYQIIDTRRTEWQVAAGLAYQGTRFDDVEAGEAEGEQTGAVTGAMLFEQEWTRAVDFTWEYKFYVVNETSGRYTHHMITKVETEWTEVLDFDVSFVWDRTQVPRPGADGVVPKQDDFRLVVALGIEF